MASRPDSPKNPRTGIPIAEPAAPTQGRASNGELTFAAYAGDGAARGTSFGRLVDLAGSKLERGADFTGASFSEPARFAGLQAHSRRTVHFEFATFHSAALFGGASFDGPITFEGAEFNRAAHFRAVHFGSLADFDSASFQDSADYSSAQFIAAASFNATGFHAVADFSGGSFARSAAARFSQTASFINRSFGDTTSPATSFRSARFDGGANFLDATFHAPANFNFAQAAGDMSFDGTTFEKRASFSTARFLGDTSFSQAKIQAVADFDQASLEKLDLDGTNFSSDAKLVLPKPARSTGHITELRLDPHDVNRIGLGTGQGTRQQREDALQLIESAARRGGDLKAANAAYLKDQLLQRHDHDLLGRTLNWLEWLIAGYLVLPWHPIAVIAALLLLTTALRLIICERGGASFGRACWRSVEGSFGSLWKLKIHDGTGWQQAEAVLYKAAVIILLLTIANVWPTANNIAKSVLF